MRNWRFSTLGPNAGSPFLRRRPARQLAPRRVTGFSKSCDPHPLIKASPYRARASHPLPEGEGDPTSSSGQFLLRAAAFAARRGSEISSSSTRWFFHSTARLYVRWPRV